MATLDVLLSLSIPAFIIVHLIVAPYTKVEESFNIQATHDILVYGTPTRNVYQRLSSQYDHFDFPGAVPRTFLGPVVLAGTSQPIIALVGFQYAQLIVRAVLGLTNAAALLVFKFNVERALGKPVAKWYALLQASQFHVIFYASRTLPNMFAFALTTLAFSQLLPHPNSKRRTRRFRLAIALLTFATAVFRSELAILLITVTIYGLAVPHISLDRVIPPFFFSFILSLIISVPIDSYFWQKPIWPELWGFYYNAVLGSSSEWGVSPWHYYFTSALPKMLTNPLTSLFLLPFALLNDGTRRQARALAIPSLLFVAIYSLQPHKEARFIFYVAPPLTAAAALGASYIFTRRGKSMIYLLASLAVAGSVLLSLAISTGMLVVSSLNYPGGEALDELRRLLTAPPSPDVRTAVVHTDVLSCMTGVTLFGQHRAPPSATGRLQPPNAADETVTLTFDKTEDRGTLLNPAFWERFDFALAEDPTAVLGPWEVVGVVQGFAGLEVAKPPASDESSDVKDVERAAGSREDYRVLGRGAFVTRLRERVRALTGGWWMGPRMQPKVYIMRRMRDGETRRGVTT
ncbi:hypothetical protein DL771_009097 [Monosporascus sp. 5C6A]|nr:hypothetical protein DL771_009097 [Monosporascus sp. 5C6A]